MLHADFVLKHVTVLSNKFGGITTCIYHSVVYITNKNTYHFDITFDFYYCRSPPICAPFAVCVILVR